MYIEKRLYNIDDSVIYIKKNILIFKITFVYKKPSNAYIW